VKLKDFDSLRNLAKKVRKADDILLYPKTIWRKTYEAIIRILSETTDYLNAFNELRSSETVVSFNSKVAMIEKKAFMQDPKPDTVVNLFSAFQIKKLNDNLEDETQVILFYFSIFVKY
jgi:hypothetical protein